MIVFVVVVAVVAAVLVVRLVQVVLVLQAVQSLHQRQERQEPLLRRGILAVLVLDQQRDGVANVTDTAEEHAQSSLLRLRESQAAARKRQRRIVGLGR